MAKTIKEVMEELHPAPKPSTLEEVVQRVVGRVGQSSKELIAKGLEAKHPQVEPAKESASVKLVRLKQAQGFPLTAKEKIVLGWEHLHGEVGGDTVPIKEEKVTEPIEPTQPEPTPSKTAAQIVEEAKREVLAELDSKEETSG